MTIEVLLPEKVSLNRIYAGVHFRERSRHKDMYYMAVLASRPEQYVGDFPVAVHYHFKVRGSRLDISNHAYMLKMLEDSLVACGVLPGDEQQYVGRITITAEKADKTADDVAVIHISTLNDSTQQ
jgi:hypothetical protein